MAVKNKIFFAERILNDVFAVRGREEKIDPREVYLVMDSICNSLAKQGLLESWSLGFTNSVEDLFTTTFEWLTVVDTANQNSYVALPATYASVPGQQGIVRVYFRNNLGNRKKYYDPVIIMQARDVENYRNTLGSDLEGRIGGYAKNGQFIFTQSRVSAIYGDVGMQLMIRDSAAIADDGLYPIPGDYEDEFITLCVNKFIARRKNPTDVLKDNNDKP